MTSPHPGAILELTQCLLVTRKDTSITQEIARVSGAPWQEAGQRTEDAPSALSSFSPLPGFLGALCQELRSETNTDSP